MNGIAQQSVNLDNCGHTLALATTAAISLGWTKCTRKEEQIIRMLWSFHLPFTIPVLARCVFTSQAERWKVGGWAGMQQVHLIRVPFLKSRCTTWDELVYRWSLLHLGNKGHNSAASRKESLPGDVIQWLGLIQFGLRNWVIERGLQVSVGKRDASTAGWCLNFTSHSFLSTMEGTGVMCKTRACTDDAENWISSQAHF